MRKPEDLPGPRTPRRSAERHTLKRVAGPPCSHDKFEPIWEKLSMDEHILRKLEERLGVLGARQRLGIETDRAAQLFGQGLLSFHIDNWHPIHSVIRNALKLTGLYWRGHRNTGNI